MPGDRSDHRHFGALLAQAGEAIGRGLHLELLLGDHRLLLLQVDAGLDPRVLQLALGVLDRGRLLLQVHRVGVLLVELELARGVLHLDLRLAQADALLLDLDLVQETLEGELGHMLEALGRALELRFGFLGAELQLLELRGRVAVLVALQREAGRFQGQLRLLDGGDVVALLDAELRLGGLEFDLVLDQSVLELGDLVVELARVELDQLLARLDALAFLDEPGDRALPLELRHQVHGVLRLEVARLRDAHDEPALARREHRAVGDGGIDAVREPRPAQPQYEKQSQDQSCGDPALHSIHMPFSSMNRMPRSRKSSRRASS